VWNSDNVHVIDVIPDFTKSDIEDKWNQTCKLVDAKFDDIFDASMCACCGRRCPHIDMQIGLTYTTYPGTDHEPGPSRICLSTSSNSYVIHDSYIGK